MELQVIASLKMPNCTHRVTMGGQTDSQVDASCKIAIHCSLGGALVPLKKNTETNLCQIALGGQTVKILCQLQPEFEVDQSECKSSQVVASQGSILTVVCWPFGCRSNTLTSGSLEKLAILASRNS